MRIIRCDRCGWEGEEVRPVSLGDEFQVELMASAVKDFPPVRRGKPLWSGDLCKQCLEGILATLNTKVRSSR